MANENPLRQIDTYTYVNRNDIVRIETFPLTPTVRVTMRDGTQFNKFFSDEALAEYTTLEGAQARGKHQRDMLRNLYTCKLMSPRATPAEMQAWRDERAAEAIRIDNLPDPPIKSAAEAFDILAKRFINYLTH